MKLYQLFELHSKYCPQKIFDNSNQSVVQSCPDELDSKTPNGTFSRRPFGTVSRRPFEAGSGRPKGASLRLSEGVLADNFGDGFLVQNNRIFRNIRRFVLNLGFEFSSHQDCLYDALPLSQLDRILANKRIPYVNNVQVIQEINGMAPKVLNWDDITDNFRRNHHFHESCHGVAREILMDFPATFKSEKILKILLEESFANCCELFGMIDADDQAHRIFYEANSYICMFDSRSLLKQGISLFGEKVIIRFLILCYLHANFQRNHLDDSIFDKTLEIVARAEGPGFQFQANQKKILRSLAKIAFELNPRFRFVTTGLYLRLRGFQDALPQNLNFDYLKLFHEDKKILVALDSLTHAVLGDSL